MSQISNETYGFEKLLLKDDFFLYFIVFANEEYWQMIYS